MNKTHAAALLLGIAVLTIWGSYAQEQNDKLERQNWQTYSVAPEFIKTEGLTAPVDYQTVTTGRYTTTSTYWVSAETDDWMLFNGPRGTDLCPQVLGTFGKVNAPDEVMNTASLSMVASGFKGRQLELQVHVPRFKSAPAGLDKCPGFSYDAATGMVMVGSKRIAYLDEAQPQLAQTNRNK